MVKAKKHLGQNFLQDESVIKEIIEAAELNKQDTVLEIGPGKGVLTEALLQRAKEVIAVELDKDLIPVLEKQFGHNKNFKLIHQDALKFEPPKSTYKIVANIPYYITSPLLNHYLFEQFLNNGNSPEVIVFMVQKEVAEKILAENKKHSVLSLQVHLFGEPSLVCTVPAEAFDPKPKVDSAVIKIQVNSNPKIKANMKELFWLIHMSFAQKRKKLTNNLSNALKKETSEIRDILNKLNINPDTRAENLTIKEWDALFNELNLNLHSS